MKDNNKRFFQTDSTDLDGENSIFEYFHKNNSEQLNKLADDIGPDVKEFFDTSIGCLLGQMPDELAITTMSMSKNSLNNLLYSAMMTGYIAKSVEDKVKLESVFNSDGKDSDGGIFLDRFLNN